MIPIKTAEEISILREGGKRLALLLKELSELAKPGALIEDINDHIQEKIEKMGDTAAFLNYVPSGANRPYPASICVSINEEIVHGIPNESERILKNGDIVSFDVGLIHKDFITDSAITLPVGEIDEAAKKLLATTKEALKKGVSVARVGSHIGDIGEAIETYVTNQGYAIFRELVGHGVGKSLHEEPVVPNFGKKGEGPKLKSGMVIAIEPMIGEGKEDIILGDDGYTFRTKDNSRSAHFEHTIVITEEDPEILTAFRE
jgi:methionyl aminopeptidase